MDCGSFACSRLAICPSDVKQRIIDGLGSALAVLGTACGQFDFDQLVSADDPTAQLPVLFSSLTYRSPKLEATVYPKLEIAGATVDEYWFGLGPWENTICARSGSSTYCYRLGNWLLTYGLPSQITTFKSVPGVMLYAARASSNMTLRRPDSTYQLGESGIVSSCQMSGDGTSYFANNSTGWKRYNWSYRSWDSVGVDDTNLWLVPSFDGTCVVLTSPNISNGDFFYKIGSATLRSATVGGTGKVYGAVLSSTVFVARVQFIYTIGSLHVLSLIYTIPVGLATGIWADALTVWVATTTGTYMSNDAGWTWTVLENQFAVGPGLFTKIGSADIWRNSDEPFSESVGFPLRLTNGGLLSKSPQWRNGFEDKTTTTASTEILPTTTAALSPNGLYLLTNSNGIITLYLNAWNSTKFADWCKLNDCKAGYANYCQKFGMIDPRCKASDTPGGPSPTPSNPASKDFPIWAIVLIVVGALALGGIAYGMLKKK